LSLAANARDAMPEGGRLTLETAEPRGPGDLTSQTLRGRARSCVGDTGRGMDETTLARLFGPYFDQELGREPGWARHGLRHRQAERRIRGRSK
jgi:hypothetical protein